MSNKRFFRILCILIVSVITAGLIFLTPTNADYTDGDADGPSGGGCASGDKSMYWDTCYGASWRKYEFGNTYHFYGGDVTFSGTTVTIPDAGHQPGGTIDLGTCQSFGATEVYILGLEVFKKVGDTRTSLGYHAGMTPMNENVKAGGWIGFKNPAGTLSWSYVMDKLQTARDQGYSISESLGWFCYSESWEEPPEPTVDYSTGDDVGYGTVTVTLDYHNVSATGGSSQNGVYALPKETSTTIVTFSNDLTATITSNPDGQLGNTQKNDALSRARNSRSYSIPNTNTVIIPYNGSYQTLSQRVSWTKTYTYSYSITYHYKTVTTYNIDGSVASTETVLESTTYGTPYYSSSSGSDSSTQSITIYRMAEALVTLKTSISSTVTSSTTTTNPQSDASVAWRDNTPTTANIGVNPNRIYADSSSNSKYVTVNFVHTVLRGNNANVSGNLEEYDLRTATVRIPWSVTGATSNSGTYASSSAPSSSNVYSNSRKVCNDSTSNCSGNDSISLGTFNKEICQSLSSSGVVAITYPPSNYNNNTNSNGITASACAHLYRPYNFNLTPTTTVNSDGMSALGSELSVSYSIDNNANTASGQEGTHSTSPAGTTVRVIRFVIDRTVENDSSLSGLLAGGDYDYDNACDFFRNKFHSSMDACDQIYTNTYTFSQGRTSNSLSVDHISNSIDVGDKVCYATAVNYVNSTYNPTGNGLGYGTMNPNRWRISNASCNTTAKRPHFNVLGGSIYGSGDISGAITKIYNPSTNRYSLFGSWVDFGIVSNGNINYVASGASLAGGNSDTNGIYTCNDNNPLSVANTNCSGGTGSGNAGIYFNSTTIDRIMSHYAGNVTAKNDKNLHGNLDISSSSNYSNFTNKYYTTLGNSSYVNALGHETHYRYTYIGGNATISASSDLGNGITHIIYATGKITIASDLKYSSGSLDDSVLIPQYLIIADGGIDIRNNVSEIDAWLISPSSTVNTCAEHSVAGGGSGVVTLVGNACENQLHVNGPVFANTVLLNRTHGAEPSSPAEPAEVFDMSATTFFWGYTQARDYAQAKTVYTRELAPRY